MFIACPSCLNGWEHKKVVGLYWVKILKLLPYCYGRVCSKGQVGYDDRLAILLAGKALFSKFYAELFLFFGVKCLFTGFYIVKMPISQCN
ncbi:hypothetical protein AXW37_09385 [Yersinia ruckeri]|nr:hypothetical protein NJ56_15635 [Yersinia ruckeri]EKN4196988.1 hypothetical protein [Yersinia ruckeri]EKN4698386.1 hypothetical protein [Yersinia ruckeri]OIX36869.1 hypothetical protein AXW19_09025 [Yersinia ruckeri]OIX37240.1 hypothetical protein AXW20_09045 [Yersinia ruckeri]